MQPRCPEYYCPMEHDVGYCRLDDGRICTLDAELRECDEYEMWKEKEAQLERES